MTSEGLSTVVFNSLRTSPDAAPKVSRAKENQRQFSHSLGHISCSSCHIVSQDGTCIDIPWYNDYCIVDLT